MPATTPAPTHLLDPLIRWAAAERHARQTEADVLAGRTGPDDGVDARKTADALHADLFRAAEAHLEGTERTAEVEG